MTSGRQSSPYSAGSMQMTRWPAPLNSGEVARVALPTATAKLMRVGGTLSSAPSSSKLPLMESLPPMAPTPRSICAMRAPSTAAVGWPQRSGTSRRRSKYSWNER